MTNNFTYAKLKETVGMGFSHNITHLASNHILSPKIKINNKNKKYE